VKTVKYKAKVVLDHTTGPVTIEITAATAEVTAFAANSIKGHFTRVQTAGKPQPKPVDVTNSDRMFYDFLRDFFRLRRR
jgi:hypothetical protein